MNPKLWAVEEFLQLDLDDDNFKERFRRRPLKRIPATMLGDAPDETFVEEPAKKELRIERRVAMRALSELLIDAPS
ncbi:MAG TPA: hypothetical protein VNC78_12075 [Actinomycetota bacterium]|nr:hypothetical protein [Actinomycetota bacterium]